MVRLLPLAAFAAISPILAQTGAVDPVFAKYAFDDWLTHTGETRIKWSAHIARPQLSPHQRLETKIEALVDGAEFAKRLGKGHMMLFVQVTDSSGNQYQNHSAMDLGKMEEGIRKQDVNWAMPVFLLPGEYRIALAIFDPETGEHSAREERLHVDPLRDDPLGDAWRDLPRVEFFDPNEPPDSWFLPDVKNQLHLPVTTRQPVHVQVILNLTPSEHLSGSTRVQDRNLGRLIPAMKDISQIDLSNGSISYEVLDLSRQRVTFHQENARELNWPRMKESLSDAKPGVIDVKSLENRGQSAGFFVKEVSRNMEAEGRRVLIILSSPVEFDSKVELPPIEASRSPDTRVFYIRYHATNPRAALLQSYMAGTRGRAMGPPLTRTRPGPANHGPVVDQLARTLKPLDPRVIDVAAPEDYRKALAEIIEELAK